MNLQADVEFALLDLAQLAPAIGKVILRQPSLVPNSAQVCGEHVPQVQARVAIVRRFRNTAPAAIVHLSLSTLTGQRGNFNAALNAVTLISEQNLRSCNFSAVSLNCNVIHMTRSVHWPKE
jgi:hypothetical protein